MIDLIINAPVLLKIIVSLMLILAFNSALKNLIAAVLAATIIFAFWCGHDLRGIGSISLSRLISFSNLQLMMVIVLVIWLSSQMSKAGVMKDLVNAVRSRLSPRTSMAVLPAIVGWLPMPGGALFSAPMVDECDTDKSVNPTLKVQANYWFRHIWECWWPLYPGVLLALEISRLDIFAFILVNLPLSGASILAGYLFLLRKIRLPSHREDARVSGHPLLLILPIITVVVVFALIKVGHQQLLEPRGFPPVSKFVPVMIGILAAMFVLQQQRPMDMTAWKGILLDRRTIHLALMVAAVRIFGAFVESDLPGGGSLIDAMRSDLERWGVPVVAVIGIVPFVAGLSTGVSIAYVGASFPIIISLLGQNPATADLLATVVLGQACGFVGMILSPIHVCLIVTNQHFSTRLLHSLRGLILPGILVIAIGIIVRLGILWAL